MPHIRIRNLLIGSLALLFALAACGPSSARSDSSGDNSSASGEPTESSTADKFPLEPNPIAVTAVLDTKRAVSNNDSGIGSSFVMNGTTAEKIPFSLMLDTAKFKPDADGNLSLSVSSVITATPVSSITGLPFSNGYLAAVHLGPDGLLMEKPGTLSFELPGLYDESTLIGFAADETGTDFHLFPVMVAPLENANVTDVYFNIAHFSLYGVALVTAQEIQTQLGHPPVNPGSQDDQELAPLIPILFDEDLTPLPDSIQLQLGNSYNRLVKPYLVDLANVQCNRVDVATYQFNAWRSKVRMANQDDFYAAQIKKDAESLLARLTECAKVTCMSCINNTNGNKPDSASINQLLVLAAFAGDMAKVVDDYDQYAYWLRLSNKCGSEAGLPNLYGIGWDVGAAGSTPEPLVCK